MTPERSEATSTHTPIRVLVCGSRDFMDVDLLNATLSDLHQHTPISCIIEGNASGADQLAGAWAIRHDVPFELYPAKWAKHGKRAGFIRNQRMIDEGKPNMVVAFSSKYVTTPGTADMIRRADTAKILVKLYCPPRPTLGLEEPIA